MKKNLVKKGDNFLFSTEEYKLGPFYVVERVFKDTGKITAEFTGPVLDMTYYDGVFTLNFHCDIMEKDIDGAIKHLEEAKEVICEYRKSKEAGK